MPNKHSEKLENKKPNRNVKTKIYLLTLVVGAGLIVAGLYYQDKRSPDSTADDSNSISDVEVVDKKNETAKNYLEGTLNNSDNPILGNFKLMSSAGEIYLKTTRDFSGLVGLQVLVLINGTTEKFELIDVQSKITGDGYIFPQ